VSSWQRVLFALTVVCAVVLLGAAAALANGPSAGDQQYIDPLSGSHHHSKSNTSSGSSSTTPTVTPTTSTPAPATVTPTTSTTATSASSTPSTTTTSSGSHDPSGKTLPFTGFDVWLAAALGLGLLTTGVYLRRVSSQA
jgi:hypothetical protein